MEHVKDRKIVFIDQTSEFDHHMIFNSAALKMLQKIFETSIDYYSTKSSKQSVFELLTYEQKHLLNFHPLNYSKSKKANLIFRLYNYVKKERIRFISFKSILKNTKNDDIIFLSTTTFTSFLAFKYLKQHYPQTVITILHGDIDFLYKAKSFMDKLNGFCHKLIFKIKADNFYYCVLNKISKGRLVSDGFLTDNELLEINHPIETKNNLKNIQTKNDQLVLGHIGSLELERKNSHLFYALALKYKKEVEREIISFRAIGLSTPNMKAHENKWIQKIVGNDTDENPKYLDRNTYEKELGQLQYALFFYPENEYVFRASGAIADAIAMQIPIIALRHPYFEYLFKIGGDIGYMCNSFEEIEDLIRKISRQNVFKAQKHENQVCNLKNLNNIYSISGVANDLQNQLKYRNIIQRVILF